MDAKRYNSAIKREEFQKQVQDWATNGRGYYYPGHFNVLDPVRTVYFRIQKTLLRMEHRDKNVKPEQFQGLMDQLIGAEYAFVNGNSRRRLPWLNYLDRLKA